MLNRLAAKLFHGKPLDPTDLHGVTDKPAFEAAGGDLRVKLRSVKIACR